MSDPMFGLQFDPAKVKYEPTPASVLARCFGPKPDFEWTFAHARKDGNEYFVVMVIPGSGEGDVFGSAISLKGTRCEVEPSNWMLSGFVPPRGYSRQREPARLPGLGAVSICEGLPVSGCHYVLGSAAEEALLRTLIRDGLERGVRAWGSDTAFRKAVCRPPFLVEQSGYPVVQQELSRFCKR